MSQWPTTVSKDRKSHRGSERMFGALSKEIHKMFVSGDRSFKKFSDAHNVPGSSPASA